MALDTRMHFAWKWNNVRYLHQTWGAQICCDRSSREPDHSLHRPLWASSDSHPPRVSLFQAWPTFYGQLCSRTIVPTADTASYIVTHVASIVAQKPAVGKKRGLDCWTVGWFMLNWCSLLFSGWSHEELIKKTWKWTQWNSNWMTVLIGKKAVKYAASFPLSKSAWNCQNWWLLNTFLKFKK